MKVVHVQWEDPAFAQSGWMQKPEFEEWVKRGIAQSDSVGLLAYETDDYIVLVQSVGRTQIADCVKINRASVKSVREIGHVDIELKIGDES